MKGRRGRPVAAGWYKLGAAYPVEADGYGWRAAPTTTGRASTVRWPGSGKQDGKVYERNQRLNASQRGFRAHPLALGGPASRRSRHPWRWTRRCRNRYGCAGGWSRATAVTDCLRAGHGRSCRGRTGPCACHRGRAGLLPCAVRPGGVRAGGGRNHRSLRRRWPILHAWRSPAAVDYAHDRRRARVRKSGTTRPRRPLVT